MTETELMAILLCEKFRGDPYVVHEDGKVRWESWVPIAEVTLKAIRETCDG